VPLLKDRNNIIQAHILLFQQDQKMEHQVGRLTPKQVIIVVFRFNDQFNGFLPNLLRILLTPRLNNEAVYDPSDGLTFRS
jgi:hypothetical protein